MNFMGSHRYLCSELVLLRSNSREYRVNLEEIWETGAVIESDEPLEMDNAVEIRCGPAFFAGRVSEVEKHEYGWRIELHLSPMTPWDPAKFRPKHMLEVAKLSDPPS
jgi:hypothetical protein